jgi:hypothetical protein
LGDNWNVPRGNGTRYAPDRIRDILSFVHGVVELHREVLNSIFDPVSYAWDAALMFLCVAA